MVIPAAVITYLVKQEMIPEKSRGKEPELPHLGKRA